MNIEDIARAAREQGFQVTRTGRGHWRFVPPEGQICIFSGTPGDRRAIHNLIACLRRQGFIWPPRR